MTDIPDRDLRQRDIVPPEPFTRCKTGALSFAFWAINIGLALMVTISILPQGLMQTWASVEYGLWYARSAEFLHTGLMDTLRWLRVIGDTIFAAGVISLGWFVLGLKTGWSVTREDSLLKPLAEQAKERYGVS